MDDALLELLDRQRILEVVLRYCRGIDRLDMDLVRSAYHPGGIDHHTGFDGEIEDYIPWVERGLGRLGGTMHRIGNHLAEISGDGALVETYGAASHWGEPRDDPTLNFTTGFRYVDWMERRNGVWGIVERFAVREWAHSDAGRWVTLGRPGPSAARSPDDPIYRLRSRLVLPSV
jgi:hypothetical protein